MCSRKISILERDESKARRIYSRISVYNLQVATTCEFASSENPLNEALRTCFICYVNNATVSKAIFKINADELTFNRAIEVERIHPRPMTKLHANVIDVAKLHI